MGKKLTKMYQRRLEMGLSLEELSILISEDKSFPCGVEVSKQVLSYVERGGLPRLDKALKISNVMKLPIEDLLDEEKYIL